MLNVAIAGTSVTKIGTFLGTPLRALAHEAVNGMLADAGIGKERIDAADNGDGWIQGDTAVNSVHPLAV